MLGMDTEPETDRALFAALGRRPRASVEAIHARHADALTAYAQAIVGRREWAEDAVQETFAEMLANPHRFIQANDPKGYLFGAVRFSVLGVLRRQRRWWTFASSMPEKPWLVPAAAEERKGEDLEVLANALASLPPTEREAVVLKCYGGLSFVQMGEATGESPKTLESRYYAALTRLKAKLGRQG
jgi:RNA polymerase sigma factor (sigma-70 family)